MVIKWSDFAKTNLKDFYSHTHMETKNVTNYIKSLVNYVDCLAEQNYLGKVLCYFKSFEIRQLIYKKHRIFYYIFDDEIRIIAVVHAMQDLKSTLKNIQKYFY